MTDTGTGDRWRYTSNRGFIRAGVIAFAIDTRDVRHFSLWLGRPLLCPSLVLFPSSPSCRSLPRFPHTSPFISSQRPPLPHLISPPLSSRHVLSLCHTKLCALLLMQFVICMTEDHPRQLHLPTSSQRAFPPREGLLTRMLNAAPSVLAPLTPVTRPHHRPLRVHAR